MKIPLTLIIFLPRNPRYRRRYKRGKVPSPQFHFAQWEIQEYQKFFHEVKIIETLRHIPSDSVVLSYCSDALESLAATKCHAKFNMLFPGFGFHPYKRPEQRGGFLSLIEQYDAVFVNEGPIWESFKGHPRVFLVSISGAHEIFRKTRTRTEFQKIIQVAERASYKGRHISEATMSLLPYKGSLYPSKEERGLYIPWISLPDIYQQADGFLSPNMIGPSPSYEIDAKYTQSTIEAGLSGCIIFWHDCLSLGNSFETVFSISLDPKEIAQKVRDVVGSINLDKHSALTAQEFYEKCNAESVVKSKVEIMKRFL